MNFIKRLIIMSGESNKGTLNLERNAGGVFGRLGIFGTALASADLVMKIDGKTFFVRLLGGGGSFSLTLDSMDSIHAACFCSGQLVMYGTNEGRRMAGAEIEALRLHTRQAKSGDKELENRLFSQRKTEPALTRPALTRPAFAPDQRQTNAAGSVTKAENVDKISSAPSTQYHDEQIAEENYYPASINQNWQQSAQGVSLSRAAANTTSDTDADAGASHDPSSSLEQNSPHMMAQKYLSGKNSRFSAATTHAPQQSNSSEAFAGGEKASLASFGAASDGRPYAVEAKFLTNLFVDLGRNPSSPSRYLITDLGGIGGGGNSAAHHRQRAGGLAHKTVTNSVSNAPRQAKLFGEKTSLANSRHVGSSRHRFNSYQQNHHDSPAKPDYHSKPETEVASSLSNSAQCSGRADGDVSKNYRQNHSSHSLRRHTPAPARMGQSGHQSAPRPRFDSKRIEPLKSHSSGFGQRVPPISHSPHVSARGGTFYERNGQEIERLMAGQHDTVLEKLLPGSRWVKVDYDQSRHYVVGVTHEHLCYGVPAEFSIDPPEELDGYCWWLPLEPNRPQGKGYWLMYQSLESGETILPATNSN